MEKFFEKMLENLKKHFKESHNMAFTNQTVESCMALYELCKNEKPQKVVEVGTNYGASTIALALGFRDSGASLSDMTTIDRAHVFWKEGTPSIQKEILNEIGLDISEINTVTKDFTLIEPEEVLDPNSRTLIFYDMHDHKGPWSHRLYNLWYPYISKATFIIHDITPVDASFEIIDDPDSPRTKATHFSGQTYAGFNECKSLVVWVNKRGIVLNEIPGGVFFRKG